MLCMPGTWTGMWGPFPGVEHSKDHCRNLKLIRVASLVFKLASSGCLISSLRINRIQHQETGHVAPRQPANSGKVVSASQEVGCGRKGNYTGLPRCVFSWCKARGEEQCI